MSAPASIDLPSDLLTWVEATTNGRVVGAAPHVAGASRSAWSIDVQGDRARAPRSLFMLRDKGKGGGSMRDAAVLRALAKTDVPVPEVVGSCEVQALLLLQRIAGRSDYPSVDDPSEREPIARHLMELTGRLHALDVTRLAVPHLEVPKCPEDCARGTLAQARAAATALGAAADPFFGFALDWLEANVPTNVARYALVHSDMGPGNFLYESGRVTGIVDWEVAHFGDPMEDLAAIAVRDMATPIGSLARRFDEYESSSGTTVDLARVHYYRALVLVRNSLMIGLGLSHPAQNFDVVEMTMYQTLLMRAAALVLCDNLGIDRPSAADADAAGQGASAPTQRQAMLEALRRDMLRTIVPATTGAEAEHHCERLARALETFAHEAACAPTLERHEREDAAALLGLGAAQLAELADAESIADALRVAIAERSASEADFARYFARRMHRLAKRNEPLLGPLFERLPQPLATG